MNTIGESIKKIRKKKGLTQKELANIMGCAEITIRQYELGKRQPSLDILQKIAVALDIDFTSLLDQKYVDLVNRSMNESDSAVTSHYPVGATVKNLDDSPFDDNIICTDEKELILNYRMLNSLGRVVAVERVKELTEINKYTEQHEIKKDS